MIRKILAFLLAFLLGWIAGAIFNMTLVHVSHVVYPFPEGVDPNNFEAIKAHVVANGLPTGALMIVLMAHAGGSFVSGLVAMRSWYLAAAILGAFWTCGGIAMLMMLPSPTWFAVADILLYVPGALLGVKLGGALTDRRPRPTAPQ